MPAPLDGQRTLDDPYGAEGQYAPEPDGGGFDVRRYLMALLRYKWLIVVAAMLGAVGGVVAWRSVELEYNAEGNLWIETGGGGAFAPIRTGGLLQSNAWVELFRSFAVLDSVALELRLYIQAPKQYEGAFANFTLGERFVPGAYELRVAPNGADYSLYDSQGTRIEQGKLGEPVGANLGFHWTPVPGAFPAGATVDFTVLNPRDAARNLRARLRTSMDPDGNFVRLSLQGSDPDQITAILNAAMDRQVALAADLKRAKLDEQRDILEEQLKYTETELSDAERDLEEFRVKTITLPSDQTPIAAGLQLTRSPVFENFFQMRVSLEQMRHDHERLQAALDSIEKNGHVRVEALEVINAASRSSELRRILDELVDARSRLRALRDRYRDDYGPVQDVLTQISTIETQSVPGVVDGILSELGTQEKDLQARIDNASNELQAIPPRTIEEGRLQRRVSITSNLYDNLRQRVETARLAAASSIPDVRILDRASVPRQPLDDQRLRLAAMVFLGFVGTSIAGAFVLDYLDARFRYASDVSRHIGLDILGSIPRIQAGRGRKGVMNAAQALEAFRELRIHTGFAYGSAGPIVLTVSSPSSGEGKSLISSNLAVAFAEVGRRTVLVDGDTRRGDAHKLLGMKQEPGLIDYLKARSGQEIIQTTEHANLDFIACGSRGTSTPELLASSRMADFMGALKRSYEVIVVDTPPLAAGGDALILSTLTGNLAVVIRTGTTEKQLAQAKIDQLARLPVRVLGAILNDVDPTDGYYYYYSAYLPGYEPTPAEGDDNISLIAGGGTQAS